MRRERADSFRGRSSRKASPYHDVQSGDPPTAILHGEADVSKPKRTSRMLAEAMKDAGRFFELNACSYETHGIFNFARGEKFYETLREVNGFPTSLDYLEGSETLRQFRKRQQSR